MILYPAIDIMGGRCVRLRQGDFARVTEYSADPAEQALEWERRGAEYIHVVDLDGARHGESRNDDSIRGVTAAVSVPIQSGGGIRNMNDIERRMSCGVSRVILGTAAVRDPELVREAVRGFGDRIAVGVDARNGIAAVEGWGGTGSLTVMELCARMRDAGVKVIIHTDIARDGMMTGPNLEASKVLVGLNWFDVIVSGGVASMDDLHAAHDIGASGAVIGRALYNGAINLEEAVRVFGKEPRERC
ncbi:MAG: 1-(5-phosphoribosyl)-5-[(5-phosphoribosylamino)methylideneamino]imidazole-4-carboxamide isomerase [Synergistaceae bacterium]|jgi:phosphoribosylformimino-5-aminoimidazole carboxamide ribotide isomerase|nr:1-(5-phosphoribosyl)-5-[(5-phosphoribosylamino)methylideneamino]imidazole-4-carboxamide isomerase [Synergistaceae bacterium]